MDDQDGAVGLVLLKLDESASTAPLAKAVRLARGHPSTTSSAITNSCQERRTAVDVCCELPRISHCNRYSILNESLEFGPA